jgi:hypothetical protein
VRLAAAAALAVVAGPALAAQDPYEALKAMDGHWIATTSSGRTQTVDNHCARTGLFFVCEQALEGKPTVLVVFLPKAGEQGRLMTFQTQTLTAAGDRAGPWRELTIDHDRWTYAGSARPLGVKRRERTVVTHSGPDFMHAEIQASTDGHTWTVVSSEDLNRAP